MWVLCQTITIWQHAPIIMHSILIGVLYMSLCRSILSISFNISSLHRGIHTMAPLSVKQPWRIWVSDSHESTMDRAVIVTNPEYNKLRVEFKYTSWLRVHTFTLFLLYSIVIVTLNLSLNFVMIVYIFLATIYLFSSLFLSVCKLWVMKCDNNCRWIDTYKSHDVYF